MKKKLTLLLFSIVAALALSLSAQAAGVKDQGTCGAQGSTLNWTLTDDGVLTISGAGAMADWHNAKNWSETPWEDYADEIKTVVIRSGVTHIGDYAFYDCFALTSVTIPSGVTSLGSHAFYDCYNLPSVSLPSTVTSLGEQAFAYCGKLSSFTLPEAAKSLGERVFYKCSAMKTVKLPTGLTKIPSEAFYGCKALTSVTIPSGVTYIGGGAFQDCVGLTRIAVPKGVKAIYGNTFDGCKNLTDVTLPAGLTGIYEYAFCECESLKNLTIPSTVTVIDQYAFSFCESLTELKLPAGLTTLGAGAFEICTSLTKMEIPSGVTKIAKNTFRDCKKMTTVIIPSTVTAIEEAAFKSCAVLNGVTLPKGLTVLGKQAFRNCAALTSIAIPSGIKSLTDEIFYDCVSLRQVTIPSSVTGFGAYVFYNCPAGLTIIGAPGSAAEKYAKEMGYGFRAEGQSQETPQTLPAPTGVKVSNEKTGIKVTWSKVTGAAKYRVFYKPAGGSWTKAGDTTAASYTWTKAKSGTTYQIRVRCITSDGKTGTSDFSAAKSIKYIAAPKDVKVSNASNGIKITWTKSTGAAKYRIYYKTGSGSWKTLTHTTSNSYTWTGAKNGTKYTFRVRCATGDGKSVTSSYTADKSITYKKTSTYKYEAPTGVKVSNEKTGIKVTWTKVSGAAKYRVFYKPEGGSWTKAGDTTSTSYTWTKAKSGTTYQIRVRCITSDGKTGTSDFSAAKTIKYIAAPKDVKVSSTSTGIKISWTKSTGAAKYRIYYKTGSGSWKTLVNTKSTSYTWTGAKDGVKYTFRVRCVTSDAKSVTSGYTADKTITYKK